VKNVNPDAYIVGEIWYESQPWLQGDQFDAVMNYPLSGAMLGFFIDDLEEQIYSVGDYHKYLQQLSNEQFMERIAYLQDLYDPAINAVMLNLLNSHDTPRFITSAKGDENAFRMALLFMFCYPGAPCIFYGDEIGMSGRNDRMTRRLDVGRKPLGSEPFRFCKSLHRIAQTTQRAAAGRIHPALQWGWGGRHCPSNRGGISDCSLQRHPPGGVYADRNSCRGEKCSYPAHDLWDLPA
jgi:glycosidase